MGIKLDAAFRAAGLTALSMHLEAVVGEPGAVRLVTAELIVTMLPEIQSRGVATAAEVDIETLGQRMRLEIEAASVIVSRSEVGAWSRAPT